ncbi:hypothetical protein C8R44DRAFT_732727 [Mycena epipterygia]|nr:hypothetical protein C8R44DRAFT_732727 [Mycena epipterygia]
MANPAPAYSANSIPGARPPSPAGSTNGVYVRSRPTSIDGSVLDVPFAQFSLTPTIVPLPTTFPTPPKRTKVYAHSTKSMYLVTSSVLSICTTRTVVIPVRAVRNDPYAHESPAAALPRRRSSWLKGVKKMIPGILKRHKRAPAHPDDMPPRNSEGDEERAPLVQGSRAMRSANPTNPSSQSCVFSTKSTKSTHIALRTGVENRAPPRAMGVKCVRHSRSFSGYMYNVHDDEYELDDSMPELREALRVNAGIYAKGYRYERLDGVQALQLEYLVDKDDIEFGMGW